MISDDVINEIRTRADIVAVIGQHVQLRKAGRNWKGLCPFHGEKTPSFNVSPDKGFFHCFGCQKHGDVFRFVMELEGKSFVEAVEQLGARFGINVPKIDEPPEVRKARGERIAMLDINKHATAFFREVLADPKRGEPGRAYLAKRGLREDTIEGFGLGWAPGSGEALVRHLRAEGLPVEDALTAGLLGHRQSGGLYDRFRDRVMFPIADATGRVVAFGGRILPERAQPTASNPPPKISLPRSMSSLRASARYWPSLTWSSPVARVGWPGSVVSRMLPVM